MKQIHNAENWHTHTKSQELDHQTDSSTLPSFPNHASYLKHCGGHPVSEWVFFLCVVLSLSFTLWFSLSGFSAASSFGFSSSAPPPCAAERFFLCAPTRWLKAKSTHCYLGAAQDWRSVCVSVCVREQERESERESLCLCVCVRERERESEREFVCVCVCFRLQANRSG